MPQAKDKWFGISGVCRGVSKRDYAASGLFQSLVTRDNSPALVAKIAVRLADQLMTELGANPRGRAFPAIDDPHISLGLNHREAFAIDALCGLLLTGSWGSMDSLPQRAIEAADALLEALKEANRGRHVG